MAECVSLVARSSPFRAQFFGMYMYTIQIAVGYKASIDTFSVFCCKLRLRIILSCLSLNIVGCTIAPACAIKFIDHFNRIQAYSYYMQDHFFWFHT